MRLIQRRGRLQSVLGVMAFLAGLVYSVCVSAAPSELPITPRTADEARAWRSRVDRNAATLAKGLTPAGQKIFLASVQRLHDYAGAHCGSIPARGVLAEGQGSCLTTIYFNYLAALPSASYRVGAWQVYETGIYGIEWADDDLMDQDAERPFWWDLQVTWPRVDADPSPISPKAKAALMKRVHQRIRAWAAGGWSLSVDVRLVALNSCYLSATIDESLYSGGAHPNEDFGEFNWNRSAERELQPGDLFPSGVDWRAGLLKLYRGHLASGPAADAASELTDADLAPWVENGWLVTERGLRIAGHWGRSRGESLPDTDISWEELGEWLRPAAVCRSP